MTTDGLDIVMHGVRLRLDADHAPLVDYAARHLDGLVAPAARRADVQVRCSWTEGPGEDDASPFPQRADLNVVGKRMLASADEMIWRDTLRMKGLQLRFRRLDDQLLFDVDYRFAPKPGKLEKYPHYRFSKYFSLMSYLVYYPLTWYLEHYRGWVPLHASALATDRGGIVIGGLGGVGKTTTCVALTRRSGVRLVAENLIFTDGESIYGCHEPVRLDDRSLSLLRDGSDGFTPIDFPEGLRDKQLFHHAKYDRPVRPAALFLPVFSAERFVRPLPDVLATERIVAANRLTRELDGYSWYAAALHLLWSRPGLAADGIDRIARLTGSIPCYELGIDRNAGLDAPVDDILEQLD